MNQTKVGEHTYINVPLPEGARSVLFREFKGGYYVDYIKNESDYATYLGLPKGKWELVGICHVIAESEELAKGVVERHYKWNGYKCYEKYVDEIQWHEKASDSFESLMTRYNWKPNDLLIRKIE